MLKSHYLIQMGLASLERCTSVMSTDRCMLSSLKAARIYRVSQRPLPSLSMAMTIETSTVYRDFWRR